MCFGCSIDLVENSGDFLVLDAVCCLVWVCWYCAWFGCFVVCCWAGCLLFNVLVDLVCLVRVFGDCLLIIDFVVVAVALCLYWCYWLATCEFWWVLLDLVLPCCFCGGLVTCSLFAC